MSVPVAGDGERRDHRGGRPREKKRQRDDRRREAAAILLFLVGLLGFGVYITVQLNHLEAAQLEEIRQAELQAQSREAESPLCSRRSRISLCRAATSSCWNHMRQARAGCGR